MENYFEDVCKVLNKLTEKRTKDFRMNLKSILHQHRFQQEINKLAYYSTLNNFWAEVNDSCFQILNNAKPST
jgi:hypothetical protein